MKTIRGISILIAVFSLSSCGKKDIDKVSEAQACLDAATEGTALACMEKVEGLNSSSADLIRCSSYYIDQGFANPERLADVAEQLSSDSGDPATRTFTALSAMGFVSGRYDMDTNYEYSRKAFTACSNSKSPGLIYLSSLTSISTALLKDLAFIPGGADPDPADIQNELCSGGGPSDATKVAIGLAAIEAYNKDCIGRDISADPVCQQYQAALAVSSDPLTVGTALADEICP